MKSIATAAQSEAGTGLHAGLSGPFMSRPFPCTPRNTQATPTQPSNLVVYRLLPIDASYFGLSLHPDYMTCLGMLFPQSRLRGWSRLIATRKGHPTISILNVVHSSDCCGADKSST